MNDAGRSGAAPPDLIVALAKSARARAAFDSLAPSHRREYVAWIEDAKKAETRAARIAKTLEKLERS